MIDCTKDQDSSSTVCLIVCKRVSNISHEVDEKSQDTSLSSDECTVYFGVQILSFDHVTETAKGAVEYCCQTDTISDEYLMGRKACCTGAADCNTSCTVVRETSPIDDALDKAVTDEVSVPVKISRDDDLFVPTYGSSLVARIVKNVVLVLELAVEEVDEELLDLVVVVLELIDEGDALDLFDLLGVLDEFVVLLVETQLMADQLPAAQFFYLGGPPTGGYPRCCIPLSWYSVDSFCQWGRDPVFNGARARVGCQFRHEHLKNTRGPRRVRMSLGLL